MNCRKARSCISEYYDGELSRSEKAELLKHIENCTHCQKEMLFMEQVRAGLKSIPTDQLSDDFNDRLFARIYSAPRTDDSATRIRNVPSAISYRVKLFTPAFVAATVVLIAAFIGFNQLSILRSGEGSLAENEKTLIQNVNQTPVRPLPQGFKISANEIALDVARLESLQVATSLRDNKLMIDRMRLDAANNFGGFNSRINAASEAERERYNRSRRYIYPVIQNADTERNPY